MTPSVTQIDTSRLAKEPEVERPGAASAGAGPPVASGSPPDVAGRIGTAPPGEPLSWDQTQDLKEKVIAILCTCFDPEIPVNIYELGLIYEIDIAPTGAVVIRMTLTTPACPAAGSLPPEVERKVRQVPGVSSVKVDVVWDPPWDKGRMSEAARLQLGIDD